MVHAMALAASLPTRSTNKFVKSEEGSSSWSFMFSWSPNSAPPCGKGRTGLTEILNSKKVLCSFWRLLCLVTASSSSHHEIFSRPLQNERKSRSIAFLYFCRTFPPFVADFILSWLRVGPWESSRYEDSSLPIIYLSMYTQNSDVCLCGTRSCDPSSPPQQPKPPSKSQYWAIVASFLAFSVGMGYMAGIQPINEWRFFSWHPFLMTTGMVGLAGTGAVTKKLGGYENTKVGNCWVLDLK